MPNTSTTSSSNFDLTYIKLRFFTKVRRFLQLRAKPSNKPLLFHPSDHQINNSESTLTVVIEESEKVEKLGEMGKEGDNKDNGWMMVLQKSVKKLHFGSLDEKEVAVKEIKKLAKEDLKRRKLMAELGVIPPLVAMVAGSHQAVQALIQLGNGSFT